MFLTRENIREEPQINGPKKRTPLKYHQPPLLSFFIMAISLKERNCKIRELSEEESGGRTSRLLL